MVEIVHDSSDQENPLISALVSRNEVLVLDRVLRLRREGLHIFSTIEKHSKILTSYGSDFNNVQEQDERISFNDDFFLSLQDEPTKLLKLHLLFKLSLDFLNSQIFMLIEKHLLN